MEHSKHLERLHQILRHVSYLPRKMVKLHQHHIENVPDFVLFELSHKNGFNLSKAAYFVDNPDFNCMKGVAGIHRRDPELQKHEDVWQQPEGFSAYMKDAAFNQQVRAVCHESARCKGHSDEEMVADIAKQLSLEHPHYFSWDMKQGNHGILVVEKEDEEDPWDTEYLHDCAHLLSFCPIY